MKENEPIFKSIFGKNWTALPAVLRKHYQIHAYSNDVVEVTGELDINCTGLMSWLLPVFKFFKILPPFKGKNIPAKVDFKSDLNSNAFHYDRMFYPANKNPYRFHSYILPEKDNIAIEFMSYGLGARIKYEVVGKKIIFHHAGYVLKIFGFIMPLPLTFLFGKIHAEEEAVSGNSYRLNMTLTHPLLGNYYYRGEFILN